MPRNNAKPTEKVDWINDDDPIKIIAPSTAQKLAGWIKDQLPPAQRFNWLWNLLGNSQIYHNAQVQDWIVIDSDTDERDYATLTAYLADAPAAGDRVLIKEDQTVTVQTVIPDDITLKFLDGSRLLCATNIATSVLQMGSNIIIEGVLNLVLSQAGTTDKAIEYNGDNVKGVIDVENASTGTLTTAHSINASKTGNEIRGIAKNSGGGTLTNVLVDNSTEDSNDISIINDTTNIIIRSTGANTFDGLTINTSVAGSAFQDDDSFASAASNKFASSESTKTYIDAHGLVQAVNVQDGEVATGTITIPNDDTIPQNTEGDEYMTLAITPTSATNKLEIDIVWHGSNSNTDAAMFAALFQDSIANSLSVGWGGRNSSSQARTEIKFTHVMVAGTTSLTTFKVRAGAGNAGTTTFNGAASSRQFGGVLASSITIKEIQV